MLVRGRRFSKAHPISNNRWMMEKLSPTVFTNTQINVFNSDYVNNYDRAVRVLEHGHQSDLEEVVRESHHA